MYKQTSWYHCFHQESQHTVSRPGARKCNTIKSHPGFGVHLWVNTTREGFEKLLAKAQVCMLWGYHFISSSWNRKGYFSDKIKAYIHPAEVASGWILEKMCSVPSGCGFREREQCPSSPTGHEIWSLASAGVLSLMATPVCHPICRDRKDLGWKGKVQPLFWEPGYISFLVRVSVGVTNMGPW